MAYISRSQPITEGSLEVTQASPQSYAYLAYLHSSVLAPVQRMVLPTVAWAVLYQIVAKSVFPRHARGQSDLGNPSTEIPFSCDSGLSQNKPGQKHSEIMLSGEHIGMDSTVTCFLADLGRCPYLVLAVYF